MAKKKGGYYAALAMGFQLNVARGGDSLVLWGRNSSVQITRWDSFTAPEELRERVKVTDVEKDIDVTHELFFTLMFSDGTWSAAMPLGWQARRSKNKFPTLRVALEALSHDPQFQR